MPAKSEKQRRLMRWALACKRGKAKDCPPEVMKIADSMSDKQLQDFTESKKIFYTFKEFIENKIFF